MKKLLAIFMVLTLLLSLVACSGSTVDSEDEEEQEAKKITIEETVICNQNSIKVTATKLSYKEGKSKATLTFEIENTGDSTVVISSDFICINDICMDVALWCEVESGESATEEVVFTDLDEIDISVIQTIELQIHASDPESYNLLFTADPVTLETSAAQEAKKITIEETVICDQNSIKVTATKLSFKEGKSKATLTFEIENTGDSTVAISSDFICINDICMQDSLWCEVDSGATITEEVVFTELKEIEISVIQTIYIQVHASDSNTYDQLFTAPPVTLETSAAEDDYEQSFDNDGKILYESEKFRIVLRGTSEDKYAKVFVENNSNQTWAIFISDVTVNDGEGDTVFYTALPAGKKSYSIIYFYAITDDEEDPAIETTTFKFVFSNQDESDYSDENFFRSELITIDFE